ncbi:MAG: TonB-dependent receptor [Xanthomonadales bacterium]|nr:TonB-dependent receptor [Xanthomonadales bacterium]
MLNLKRNVLSMALASAVAMMAQAAWADAGMAAQQQAEDEDAAEKEDAEELDAIEVVGIRAGIESAIETKQIADSIVEAISAEDIGKLPDVSIADALARLPGVTSQRERGRSTEINVRGLSGDFATATLNGREQASMGTNRGVEFDQYASESMRQVVVYKTPTASLIGQGLSATIDLQTVRPLDFDERVIAGNYRRDQYKLEDSKLYGERASFAYIDQNQAKTLGFALGYAYLNSPQQSNSWRAWGYEPNGQLGGVTIQGRTSDLVRKGITAAMEYQPNDSHRGALDVYYSTFDSDTIQRGLEIGLGNCTSNCYLAELVSRNGTTSTYRNARPVLRTDQYASEDKLLSVGWNHEYRVNDDWRLTTDLSTSRADRDGRNFESNAGFAPGLNGTTLGVALNPGGWYDMDFGYDFADTSQLRLWDPGGWGGDGFDKPYAVEDTINQARVELEQLFGEGAISSIKYGLNFTSRDKDRFASEDALCIQACGDRAALPYPTGASAGFGFFGLPNLPTFDPNGVPYNRRDRFAQGFARKNFGVEEDITTLYAQANLDSAWGSVPVRGNFGLQVQRVDQEGFGLRTFGGTGNGEAVTRGATYTEVLPSSNLIFDITESQKLRLGLARQLARPRIDDMSAGFSFGINREGGENNPNPNAPFIWSGGGGNPELRPWIANAIDLSYEKYFASKGYVSAAWFFKDLKSYIYNQSIEFDFSGIPIPAGQQRPASNIGTLTAPANGEGGLIAGIELAVSVPFDLFWEPLEGFGLQGHYTDTRTSISPNGPGTNEPLPGFSKYTSNVTLYWERFGWGIRASRRHRSEFVGEIQNVFLDREKVLINREAIVDLQVNYTFMEGPLKDLAFFFQINNLRDEPFSTTFDSDPLRPREYVEYGRNALLGVSYRF